MKGQVSHVFVYMDVSVKENVKDVEQEREVGIVAESVIRENMTKKHTIWMCGSKTMKPIICTISVYC